MANRKYLDPAHSIISKFSGPSGKLGQGIDKVAEIVGRDRTRVYRWMLPIERGGTGGYIPRKASEMLVTYAKKRRIPVGPSDFFGGARAA